MLFAVLGGVGFLLLAIGGYFARKEYYNNKPSKIWVPLPVSVELLYEDQKKLADQIEEALRADDILLQVVRDAGLQEKFKQASEAEAVEDLGQRLFVEVGTADTSMGQLPSINIGVKGRHREKPALEAASMSVIKEVWKMVGIDSEQENRIDAGGEARPDPF